MIRSISVVFLIVYFIIALFLGAFFALFLSANQVDLIVESVLSKSAETGLYVKERLVAADQSELTAATPGIADLVNDLEAFYVSNITIADEFGNVAETTGTGYDTLDDSAITEINAAFTKRDFQGQLFHQVLNRKSNVLNLYIPAEWKGAKAVFIVEMVLTELSVRMGSMFRLTGLAMGVVFLFIILLTLYTWLQIVRPIVRISRAVDSVAAGDFDVTLNVLRNDEIGHLANSVGQMGLALRDIQQNAMSANPLTGLPGNISIEKKIRDLLAEGSEFCVVYSDLDNFKGYNDHYGVSRGDDVIVFTATVLKDTFNSIEDGISFLGHQGGDDFIGICDFESYEQICSLIIARFDSGIGAFYDKKDRDAGSIHTVDRLNNPLKIDIATISLSVVTNHHRSFANYGEIASVASEVKKLVKAKPGSTYAIDKRSS